MMEIQITCSECQSGIEVLPSTSAKKAKCDVCEHVVDLNFTEKHEKSILENCPVCERQDFYKQKDFNRKVGVILFVIAAILSIFTYGISFIVLYAFDFFLFRKLRFAAVCYKCATIFRKVDNISDVHEFNHEMNDRIIYADHNFEGKQLEH